MAAPERLGRYRLLHPLSRGGMGEVYLARIEGPAGFAKTVVVKRMLRHLLGDARAVEMFVHEAQLAASLSHPNLVQVFELGEDAGEYFIAMEYVHGPSLRGVQKRLARAQRRLEPEVAAQLVAQALRGLQHAHSFKDHQGRAVPIVHGDISPENLLLGFDGLLKVADFGVARAVRGPPTAAPQPVRGKAVYMAPEVRLRGEVTPAGDVYSAAVVLLELVARATLSSPPSADAVAEGPLREVIKRGLNADPSRRFASAAEMADALEAISVKEGAHERLRALLLELYGPAAEAHPAGAAPWLGADADDVGPPVMASVVAGTQPLPRPSEPTTQPGLSPRRGALPAVALAALVAGLGTLLLWPSGRPAISRRAEADAAVIAAEAEAGGVAPERADSGEDGGKLLVVIAEPILMDAGTVERSEPPVTKEPRGPGFLSVRANPWAEVWLGSRLLGVTPLARVNLPAGKHTLLLSHPPLSLEKSVTVTVRSSRLSVVKVDLLAQ